MNNDSPFHRSSNRRLSTRREFLWQSGGGLGGLALASLLTSDEALAQSPKLHHPAKAKRVVHFFMTGAASHIDLFDFKPELVKRHGQPSDFGERVETFQDGLGPWLKPVWDFKPYGQCGKLLGEPVSALGKVVDDIAFVHNMVSKSGVHSTATLLQATGFLLPGFPGAGCWVSYGLGSLNDNLPTFVVLPDHRGLASNGVKNWDAAFLPSQHSGTVIYPGSESPVADLFPHKSARTAQSESYITRESEAATQQLMAEVNRAHAATREGDQRLEGRIRSYELAARMQLAAPEALNLKAEPEHVLKLYGLDRGPRTWPKEINDEEETFYFAQKCLAARRLLERGVRFVQVWSGNDNGFPRRNWDSHEDVRRDHGPLATGMARGCAAFIKDLKQRGMLEDTVILWTTEFGRMPSSQAGKGRDHNPYCFTNWLCGGGIKGGVTYGESDEWGYKPRDRKNPTEVYDIHATLLRLLGIDHEKLSFYHNGIQRRLTDVHGHVIKPLLA
ncbi:MAG: DUF1501 domain-containing protein [Blastocatellales bacterium]